MINAKEIERQASRLEEQIEKFKVHASDVVSALNKITVILQSTDEDSNLKNITDSYMWYIQYSKENLSEVIPQLASIMHSYAEKTISNETITAEKINDITNSGESNRDWHLKSSQ